MKKLLKRFKLVENEHKENVTFIIGLIIATISFTMVIGIVIYTSGAIMVSLFKDGANVYLPARELVTIFVFIVKLFNAMIMYKYALLYLGDLFIVVSLCFVIWLWIFWYQKWIKVTPLGSALAVW